MPVLQIPSAITRVEDVAVRSVAAFVPRVAVRDASRPSVSRVPIVPPIPIVTTISPCPTDATNMGIVSCVVCCLIYSLFLPTLLVAVTNYCASPASK